jgi:hypothetical protein
MLKHVWVKSRTKTQILVFCPLWDEAKGIYFISSLLFSCSIEIIAGSNVASDWSQSFRIDYCDSG